ncbi:hypothetical protein ElyMa_001175400 [Elysia marginata]|uniref:Uncharacterized protein n=1 Tax=Elysia marginata TaxID=1093978 RepID=A0AAV4I1L8_9GAST|nr:hypothetical protein ElyMa_001175400 [Elysia marginata]
MILYLRDKVGVATRTRNNIVSAVFGPGGLTSSPTIAVFEERLTNIQTTINDQAPAYLQHFTSRVLPILQQNLDTMLTRTEASHDWTNNNCESILESLSAHGPAVTDKMTGFQYNSVEDLTLLHPDQDFSSPGGLAYWNPALHLKFTPKTRFQEHRYPLTMLMDVVQNRSESFEEDFVFMFEPPSDTLVRRPCLPQSLLVCFEAKASLSKTIQIANLTLACEVLQATATNKSTTFQWMERSPETNTTEGDQEVTTQVGTRTTKRRYNLASTTDYLRSMEIWNEIVKPQNPHCKISFLFDVDKTPLDFSYLLKLESPGNIRITPKKQNRVWDFIDCTAPQGSGASHENAKESGLVAENDDIIERKPCQVDVKCTNSLVFANGICEEPVLLMLEVTATPETNHEDFRLGMERLIDASKILSDPNVILRQDPATCLENGTDESENTTKASVYYGLYDIIDFQRVASEGVATSLPMMKDLRTAMAELVSSGKNLTEMIERIELCALVKAPDDWNWSSIGMQLMRDEANRLGTAHRTSSGREARNSTVMVDDCKALPWPWARNIFQDPFVRCETVEPFMHQPIGRGILDCTHTRTCEKDKQNSDFVIIPSLLTVVTLSLATLLGA